MLGLMGECVMSIYGITRLLRSRELGPIQLLPALEAVGGQAQEFHDTVDPFFSELRDAGGLGSAVEALEAETRAQCEKLRAAFGRSRTKLGARERLELERSAELLGGELQAVRALLDVVRASQQPRVVPLTLPGLVHGHWCAKPIFVSHLVELTISSSGDPAFDVEPSVAWALLERMLRRLSEEGVEHPQAIVAAEAGELCLRVGTGGGLDGSTVERVTIEVRPALPIDDIVLDAVAQRCGLVFCAASPDDPQSLSLASR